MIEHSSIISDGVPNRVTEPRQKDRKVFLSVTGKFEWVLTESNGNEENNCKVYTLKMEDYTPNFFNAPRTYPLEDIAKAIGMVSKPGHAVTCENVHNSDGGWMGIILQVVPVKAS